ncbi:6742_t:CDS:2 [Funneliformis mosseae]|uniref:6742_t:CDS:1 n=1 Tax=Funneliformis mosseae TaxID=27381 RepID=A0A9N8WRE4_FUNMO|nr:6742_t:CDS:2 [Funneliformis mosseae]
MTRAECVTGYADYTVKQYFKVWTTDIPAFSIKTGVVNLDTLLPVHTSLIDDVARMEDVYDVMSKEEIWRHRAGIASDIVRNMPSFMSIDAEV